MLPSESDPTAAAFGATKLTKEVNLEDAEVIDELSLEGNLLRRYRIGQKTGQLESVYETLQEPLHNRLLAVFLPVGYPWSVTPDYAWYQIYDSLQAFSSSIAGLISSRAVLQGVGVGDSSATPTNALLLNIAQEVFGRLATIISAHRLSLMLTPNMKTYRLLADVSNDAALVLDTLSPLVPHPYRIAVLCSSASLRALCGVLASTKASLSVHFAKSGDVGDLNAKDSSQETVIGLMGMLAGTLLMRSNLLDHRLPTFAMLGFLLAVHLMTNYLAVRSVVLTTLNRQRANILLNAYCTTTSRRILTPGEVAAKEPIFSFGHSLPVPGPGITQTHFRYGVAPHHFYLQVNSTPKTSVYTSNRHRYSISSSFHPPSRPRNILIAFHHGATTKDKLVAYFLAVDLSRRPTDAFKISDAGETEAAFVRSLADIEKAGWDLNADMLMCENSTRWRR